MCLMYLNYALTFWWSFIFTHSIRLSADTVKQESTLLMEIQAYSFLFYTVFAVCQLFDLELVLIIFT